MSLQDYLTKFKAVAAEWFEGCAFIKDNYDFFTETLSTKKCNRSRVQGSKVQG